MMVNSNAKLYLFHWWGKNAKHKKINGKLLAFSEFEARQILEFEQIKIIKIKQKTPSFLTKYLHCANTLDISSFTRQLATMLNAGVPLNDSLHLIKHSVKKAQLKQIISQIQHHIGSGLSFSDALKNSSALFDDFYCQLVATGEQTGKLEQSLFRLAVYRERSEELKRKLIKAMIYPCIVCIVALAVCIGMLIIVIPTFEDIFASFDTPIPWLTQKIIDLSSNLQQHIFHWLIFLILVFVILRQLIKSNKKFKLLFNKNILKIPIVGTILTKGALARFSRTLATTLDAGLPLITGLSTAKKTTKNYYFEDLIKQIRLQIAGGLPLYQAIKNTEAFPDILIQMIMIGEESGSLAAMLNKIASLYEDEINNAVDNLGKVLEPLLIISLGIIIGTLVIAMYMPMFNLMDIM